MNGGRRGGGGKLDCGLFFDSAFCSQDGWGVRLSQKPCKFRVSFSFWQCICSQKRTAKHSNVVLNMTKERKRRKVRCMVSKRCLKIITKHFKNLKIRPEPPKTTDNSLQCPADFFLSLKMSHVKIRAASAGDFSVCRFDWFDWFVGVAT